MVYSPTLCNIFLVAFSVLQFDITTTAFFCLTLGICYNHVSLQVPTAANVSMPMQQNKKPAQFYKADIAVGTATNNMKLLFKTQPFLCSLKICPEIKLLYSSLEIILNT